MLANRKVREALRSRGLTGKQFTTLAVDKDDNARAVLEAEARISLESPRRRIPLDRLLAAVVRASGVEELAEDLWVDVDTLLCRIEHLRPSERAAVDRVLAAWDDHTA